MASTASACWRHSKSTCRSSRNPWLPKADGHALAAMGASRRGFFLMTDIEATAYVGARIFDGDRWHDDAALIVAEGKISSIGAVPAGAAVARLDGGTIVPGFIDLQVNGGGGH